MANGPGDSRLALYAELSQVGLEMAAPIGAGAAIDYGLGTAHWGAVIGAVLGFVAGLTHLVILANRGNKIDDRESPKGKP